jgi:hypothetical protein
VIFFDGKDIGPIIFLVVRGDRILYHIFGRDRGYDIIYTKKRICPVSGISNQILHPSTADYSAGQTV